MEASEWPPDGYSPPRAYETNDWIPYILGLFAGGITLGVLRDSYANGTAIIAEYIVELLVILGLGQNEILRNLGLFSSILVILIFIWMGWTRVLVPVHEEIHFIVSDGLGLEPKHDKTVILGVENPYVVNWKTGITRKEHIASLSSPFVLIGVVFGTITFLWSGFLASIAAFVVIANTAGSGEDIYHIFKIARKPSGTLFANIENGDEARSEYVVPENQ